jgi:hypothetical protein
MLARDSEIDENAKATFSSITLAALLRKQRRDRNRRRRGAGREQRKQHAHHGRGLHAEVVVSKPSASAGPTRSARR